MSRGEPTRRCAFLTLADPTDFVIDDELAYEPLRALGWRVDAVPWNARGVDWNDYELVVIRSTWDYHDFTEEFLATLAAIEGSSARLENSLDIVRWNLQKTYLRELADEGIDIVPTIWRDRLDGDDILPLFEQTGSDEIVIKPQVGANAQGAYRLTRAEALRQRGEIAAYYADRALMAQPLVTSVPEEGEYSLFYLWGEYSHAIRKTPKGGDFRSQEEHGADIASIVPDDALRSAGAGVMATLDRDLLYARADFVRAPAPGGWWLIELELIEPALYLRTDPGAPERFARAVDRPVEP